MSDRFVDSLTPRKFVITLLAITVLFGGVGFAADTGAVTATLSPDETEANVGEELTFDIVVEGVEDDVGAYTTTVDITDTNVAKIVDLEPAGDPLFEPDDPVSDDGATATADVVYGDEAIDSDADDEVTIATVTIETKEPGTASVEQTVETLGDGDGQSITVTESEDAELEVDTDDDGEPSDPAEPALSGLDIAGQGADATITEGNDEDISATIENVGDEQGTFEVELEVAGGLDGGGAAATEDVTLDAGDSDTITFGSVTGDFDATDYDVLVMAGNNDVAGDLVVEEPDTQPTVDADASSISPDVVTEDDTDDYVAEVALENLDDVTTADVTVELVNYEDGESASIVKSADLGNLADDDSAVVTVEGSEFENVEAPVVDSETDFAVEVDVEGFDADVDPVSGEEIDQITVFKPGPEVASATVRDDAPDEIVVVFEEEVELMDNFPNDAGEFFIFDGDGLNNDPETVADGDLSVADGDIIVPLTEEVEADDPDVIEESLAYFSLGDDGAVVAVDDGTFAQGFTDLDVTNNVEKDEPESDPDVGITHAEGVAGSTTTLTEDGTSTTAEVLHAAPEGEDTFSFGGDADRTIEVTNTDTDRTIEIIPEEDEKTFDVEAIRLSIYDGLGEIRVDPRVGMITPDEDGEDINITVEGDDDVFTGSGDTFNEFELALVEDGDRVDTSEERLIGVNYVGDIEQDGTEDEITVTAPRDEEVDEDWFVTFRLVGEDPLPVLEQEVEHSDGDDEFEFTVDVSEIESGEYSASISMFEEEVAGERIHERLGTVRNLQSDFEVESDFVPDDEIDLQLASGPDLISTNQPLDVTVELNSDVAESFETEVLNEDDEVVRTSTFDAEDDVTDLFYTAIDEDDEPVDDGEYRLRVTAFGGDGQEEQVETEPFEVDNSPPTIENLQLDTDLTNDEVTVSADVEGVNSDVEVVNLGLASGFTFFAIGEEFTDADAEGDVETTIDVDDLVGDGEYNAIISAQDEAGNVAELEDEDATVTVDTTAPDIQPRVTDLGEVDATLTIEADEDVTIDEIDIEAEADGTTEDRSPSTPTDEGDEFEIEFDGTTLDDEDTTFTIEVEAEDEIGNADTYELTTSVTSYALDENNEATVEPDSTDGSFALSASDDADGNEERSASVGQTSSAPAGTSVEPDQITDEFIDVADIGLDEDELEDATVSVPLADIDIEGIDDEDLVFFYSPEGEEDYEVIEPEIVDDELVVEVDGFSQLAPGGMDDQPPSIDDTTVDPGTDLDIDDEDVTLTFEYSPVISAIDVSETSVDVDLSDDRTDVQITGEETEVHVDDLQPDETFSVELQVVDQAGNDVTTTETISVEDAQEDESEEEDAQEDESEEEDTESDDDDGADAGASGGGGGGAGAPTPGDEQFEISAPEVSGQEDASTPIDVTATITNTGGPSDGQTIELEIDGETVAEEELTLGSDGQVTVEFNDVDISALSEGEYTYRLTTADDTYTDTLTIGTDDTDPEEDTADDSDDSDDSVADTPEEEPAVEEQIPGFGVVVALIALLATALIAARTRVSE
ncbi:PGF-CTERM sorting domain-containing protein [Halorubrum vacuolatum]|uniref:PGF-CTERM protein n=1 Tax=Halorubrum vacuolatum TaxID=63740 RepID=A0A238WC30_HALVU|nr:PGF-CTERM sorting domain-containing protein [Halorubrum vacuolatum]SNR43259.1 PGF-CTERM protein [Halorubrum vacuolatum]